MLFAVLGTVEARVDDRLLDLGQPVQQSVLAALLVDAGRVVAVDQLVERVWGERPPYRARDNLYTYISRLRRVEGVEIARRQGGYVLDVPRASVDLHWFRTLLARAGELPDDEAGPVLDEALALWRGDAFGELDTPWFASQREQLDKERFVARLRRNDIALAAGKHAELVPELMAAQAEHPLDERLAGQLMLALYRGGRQSEALVIYDRLRVLLAEELGADPSPPLRKLHLSILSPADDAVVPRQLPARPPVFVGREAELEALSSASGLVVIGGPGGAGKTSLAVRWAFDHVSRFPDGQLYVNLRGFDQAAAPLSPAAVLRGFLDALQVAPERVPDELEARSALFRQLVAGRRMLVVLDNARDEEQVRPLLPGGEASLVIVTSRNRLTGLVASEQARPMPVPLLSTAEARQLLAHRLDAARLADTVAVDELVRYTGGLPLALAIVAARALAHPTFPLRALVAELSRERLDALDAGDPAASVRAVFSWSYHALSPEAGRLFRLLGVHSGPDIDVTAAAALAGVSMSAARQSLLELTRTHLIDEHVPGRFRSHDLLRDFGAELATDEEAMPALERVLDHYLGTGFAAERVLAPHWPPIDVTPARSFDGYEEAQAWFESELQVVLAATDLAVRKGFDVHAWQLPWTLSTYLNRSGQWDHRSATQRTALAAARRLDDRFAQATALHLLGRALCMQGEHGEAKADLLAALALYWEVGDSLGAGVTHFSLGMAGERRQDYPDALDHCAKALELARANENGAWELFSLIGLGWYHAAAGNWADSISNSQEALEILHVLADVDAEAHVLRNLGYVYLKLGDFDRAVHHLDLSSTLFGELSSRYGQALTLEELGDALAGRGDRSGAVATWERAEALMDALGHPDLARVREKLLAPDKAPIG